MVASPFAPFGAAAEELLVLIPFIAGQWSLLFAGTLFLVNVLVVLIPFIAGQWSLHGRIFNEGGQA